MLYLGRCQSHALAQEIVHLSKPGSLRQAGTAMMESLEQWKTSKGSKWIAAKEAELAEPDLMKIFERSTKWRVARPWEGMAEWGGRARLRLDSVALIGLAPFHSYSFEEEQKSAKAPLQIFAAAIRRLRLPPPLTERPET